MAEYLRVRPDRERTVIAVHGSGSKPPLFCASGKGGSVIYFRALASLLGKDQPFYGITHHGVSPELRPTTVSALAACYIDAIRDVQPDGPYYLAGYSAGGFVAWEIARQLRRTGDEVAFVGLLDTLATRLRAPLWKRVQKYLTMLRRRPRAYVARYSRAVGRRILRVGGWLRGTGSLVPPLEQNRFFDSLNLLESMQPHDAPATLFLARQGRGADPRQPDAGWKGLAGPSLEIAEVEGAHDTILTDDVEELATALSQALESARKRSRAAEPHEITGTSASQ